MAIRVEDQESVVFGSTSSMMMMKKLVFANCNVEKKNVVGNSNKSQRPPQKRASTAV